MIQLYDSFGRAIQPEKRPDERVLAVTSVRDRYSTYPSKGLTPEKLGAIFLEADCGSVYRTMELFEDMEEKDTHLFSQLQTRKLAVTGLDFKIEPFTEEKRDREIADFVRDVISGLTDFDDNRLDILDGLGKGYSALEIYWDVKDNKNVIRHMEPIHQKRFSWSNSTAPRLLTKEEPVKGIDLPPFKFLFHRHKIKSGHPTRQGLMRVCAWMYLFKNYDIKDWAAFAEVYGMPLRLGKYDPSATKDDKDALIKAVQSLGSDAAGIISKSTEIEFIEAVKNSGKGNVFDAFAAFCNAEMSKAILGHSASADSTPGKLGNENQAGEVRKDLLHADCKQIDKTMRRDVIRPLVGFNYGWDVPLPWYRTQCKTPEDRNVEANRYKTHIESGMEISAEHMYEKFGIPKPKDGEQIVRPISQTAPMAMKADGCRICNTRLVNKAGEPGAPDSPDTPDTIDALTERLMKEADFGPLMEPVARLIANASSLESLREGLIDMYPSMNPTELGSLMQRAFTAAELAGRFEAQEGK